MKVDRQLRELPDQLYSLVAAELEPGEKLTWIGQPIAWRAALKNIPLILFAIPWTGFALIWMAGAAEFRIPNFQNGEGIMCLFGLPFILIGLALFSSPLWSYRHSNRTVYCVTNRRVLLITRGFQTTFRSFLPEALLNIERRQNSDGSGDIILERHEWRDSENNRKVKEVGIMAIPDVQDVEKLVIELAETARYPGQW